MTETALATKPQQLPSAEEVSEVVREIVSDPEFAVAPPDPSGPVMERIFEELGRIWNWLVGLAGENGWLAASIVALATVLAAYGMVGLLRRHAPLLRPAVIDEGATPTRERSAVEWRNLATRRAERGEYRAAATALYQSFLLTLDQAGRIAFHASKTPGDYAAEAAGAGPDAGAVLLFMERFQEVAFGHDSPTRAQYVDLAGRAGRAGRLVR